MTTPTSRALSPVRKPHSQDFALTGCCTYFDTGTLSFAFDTRSLR
jgi:hypothetical protein